jgi:hypothetical protein
VTPVGLKVVAVSVDTEQVGKEVKLASIAVPVTPPLKVGQPLPALALKDAAGKPIDLAALKGRHVLLHGWAGWCAACGKDYAGVRKVRADFPGKKLALVGLSLDADAATAGRLAGKYEFGWPQACLGGKGASAAERLQVGAIPLYMVLAPDGTLAYRGHDWREAERFLRGALAK